MNENLKKILKEEPDWHVRSIDFSSPEIKASLDYISKKQQDAEIRKVVDPSKLKLVVKF